MIRKALLICLLSALFAVVLSSISQILVTAKPGGRAELPFGNTTQIKRLVYNAKNVQQQHVFRVCNGKNKVKCGFWENVKTKKKVGSKPTFNKKKGLLIIPKATKLDAGQYSDDSYGRVMLYVM